MAPEDVADWDPQETLERFAAMLKPLYLSEPTKREDWDPIIKALADCEQHYNDPILDRLKSWYETRLLPSGGAQLISQINDVFELAIEFSRRVRESKTDEFKALPEQEQESAKKVGVSYWGELRRVARIAAEKIDMLLSWARSEESLNYTGLMRPAEIEKLYDRSWDTIKRWFASGKIRHKQITTQSYRIHKDDLP